MEDNLSFYNMIVHIVYQGNMIEENVAVKNIWEKDEHTFIDLYFYRTKKSQVINGLFIHDILDLNTEKSYGNVKELLFDYMEDKIDVIVEGEDIRNYSLNDFKHIEEMRDEIVILTFLAKCNNIYTLIKENTIRSYIKKHEPSAENLSHQYLSSFLKSINPDEDDFYESLENIKSKTPERVCDLARTAVSIGVSDGRLEYNEKIYVAEILQKLREQGLEPDVGL